MGRDFTNFDAVCHGPVPLGGLFRGRASRKRSRTINQSRDERTQDFQVSQSIPESFGISLSCASPNAGRRRVMLRSVAAWSRV